MSEWKWSFYARRFLVGVQLCKYGGYAINLGPIVIQNKKSPLERRVFRSYDVWLSPKRNFRVKMTETPYEILWGIDFFIEKEGEWLKKDFISWFHLGFIRFEVDRTKHPFPNRHQTSALLNQAFTRIRAKIRRIVP